MEKFIAFLASVEALANVVAASDAFPSEVRSQASRVGAAVEAVKGEIAHPNANKLWDYFKNGGNLHGTPESRKAEGLDY